MVRRRLEQNQRGAVVIPYGLGCPALSEPANPTWQQDTGMTYTQAFRSSPIKVTFNSDTDTVSLPGEPIIPGAGLGDFFFGGCRQIFHRGVLTGQVSRSVVPGRGYSRI